MDQLQHYQSHPPRCIAGFTAEVVDDFEFEFDGHPSASQLREEIPNVEIDAPEYANPVFALKCICGGTAHQVLGNVWTDPEDTDTTSFNGPYSLFCLKCNKNTEVFDPQKHGHDAEHGYAGEPPEGKTYQDHLECGECKDAVRMKVYTRFEYPDDLLTDQDEERAGKEQDFFTWFTMIAECEKCSGLMIVADCECA